MSTIHRGRIQIGHFTTCTVESETIGWKWNRAKIELFYIPSIIEDDHDPHDCWGYRKEEKSEILVEATYLMVQYANGGFTIS